MVANSRGDGYTIAIEWNQAFPDSLGYVVAYNIYFSTVREDVFTEGVKLVSITPTIFDTDITDFTPGDTFYFAVRATEFDPTVVDLSLLPDAGDAKMYPESMLLFDIDDTTTSIPVIDINEFPAFGIIQIGSEFILYLNKDIPTSSLINATRGYLDTTAKMHTVDGYDGYTTSDPLVHFWKGYEEGNQTALQETSAFIYPNYPRTNADGYKIVAKDILTTDLGGSDESNGAISVPDGGTTDGSITALPPFDFSGWHRTDPVALLRGDCIGTYYGGEQHCADGYLGVGNQIRGLSISDANAQRQEVLLNATGEPVVLVRRRWTGMRCPCFMANVEQPDDRCPICFGVGFVTGYDQFVNPRRSDGRIVVRFGPTEDSLIQNESGLESTFIPDCFTIVVPSIKNRDFLIRFNEDGTEEFRYEVLNVTRNKIFQQDLGGQKFKAQRVRKTDPIYMWRAIRNTATMPQSLTTTIGMVPGPGGIPPHTHNIVINENIVSLSQINQTTNVAQGHNHPIINGVVQVEAGHTHAIIL
ncbi:MAG TPA: hypothetical protein VM577_07330 [Anaerovoracaceae bacterium]|nr:hypothetical protein [Anaerovoracaceae bacterium]